MGEGRGTFDFKAANMSVLFTKKHTTEINYDTWETITTMHKYLISTLRVGSFRTWKQS